MKILNELRLKLDNPSWVLDPELALIDTILNENPRLYEIVAPDIVELNKSSTVGRQDSPTVEQVVRAALYKEMKKLDYRELEYAQEDSRICGVFIKLEGRSPFSFEVFQKYISRIRSESLRTLMVEINRDHDGGGRDRRREESEGRQYGGGDGHSLSYEQFADLGLHEDEPSAVEEAGGDGEDQEGTELSEAGEEERV